jgi:hypothetical protein
MKSLNPSLKKTLDSHGIFRNNQNWSIYIPCDYNNPNLQKKIKTTDINQKLFLIKNCGIIVNKAKLWSYLYRAYGDAATRLVPKTYLIPSDLNEFQTNFHGRYIAKKNVQRQEGLLFSDSYETILNEIKKDRSYVVIQEYLENPLLFLGHKVNFRVYVMILCMPTGPQIYLHDTGLVYYTPLPYHSDSMEFDRHITSYYDSVPLYNRNFPLTIKTFKNYLRSKRLPDHVISPRIERILKQVLNVFMPEICKKGANPENVKFQLFGADFFVDENFGMKLIEINKGPGMIAKSGIKADQDTRDTIYRDIFSLLGVIPSKQSGNGFKRIL